MKKFYMEVPIRTATHWFMDIWTGVNFETRVVRVYGASKEEVQKRADVILESLNASDL